MTANYNTATGTPTGNTGYPEGFSVGQATTDKIGFYGTAPLAQQASTVGLVTQLANLGLVASGTVNQGGGAPVNVTAAGALSAAVNAGRVTTVNSAAGIALTLPAATGTGNIYRVYIGTTVTSIGTTITAAGSDKLWGNANQAGSAGAATIFYTAGGSIVTLNGTTKGGIKGDLLTFIDVGSALWSVSIESSITGTAATPFS